MKHRRWLGSMAGAALAIAIAVLLGGPPYAWAAGPQPPAARIQSMRDGAAAMRKSGELPLAGCTWTGATDSDWATATNWTGCVGATPAGSDAVTIDSGANQPIMSNGTNVTILSLAINSGASVQVSGMLSITNGSGSGRLDLQGGGTLNVQPGGVVSIGSGTTISGTLAVKSGALARFDLGYSNATITSTGVLTGGGDVLVTNIIPASGGLAVYAGYPLGGQLTLDATGRASFYTPSSVPRLSIIDAFSALDGNSTVTVTQAMTWTGGNLNGTLTLVIGPGATLNVDSASTIQLGGSGKLYNSGTANWLRGTFYANSLAFVNQPGGVFNALGNIVIVYRVKQANVNRTKVGLHGSGA